MNNLTDNGNNIKAKYSKDEDNSSKNNYIFPQGEETVKKIPLFIENLDVTKKTEETQLKLTKKWLTTTKKIEIPVKYEEMLINDKEFDAYNEGEIAEIFSKIKHKITDVFSHHEKDKDNEDIENGQQEQEQQQHRPDEIEVKKYDEHSNEKNNTNQSKKLVPFLPGGKNNEAFGEKEEHIIPLWGEEITINKKMVKIGEIVIRKYEINEKQKIDVDLKSEQLTIKYPDNHKEEII
jgi:stress response protein YsnF